MLSSNVTYCQLASRLLNKNLHTYSPPASSRRISPSRRVQHRSFWCCYRTSSIFVQSHQPRVWFYASPAADLSSCDLRLSWTLELGPRPSLPPWRTRWKPRRSFELMTASCHSYLGACPAASAAHPTHLVTTHKVAIHQWYSVINGYIISYSPSYTCLENYNLINAKLSIIFYSIECKLPNSRRSLDRLQYVFARCDLDLWPFDLIKCVAKTHDGLSLWQVWRLYFQPFWFYRADKHTQTQTRMNVLSPVSNTRVDGPS